MQYFNWASSTAHGESIKSKIIDHGKLWSIYNQQVCLSQLSSGRMSSWTVVELANVRREQLHSFWSCPARSGQWQTGTLNILNSSNKTYWAGTNGLRRDDWRIDGINVAYATGSTLAGWRYTDKAGKGMFPEPGHQLGKVLCIIYVHSFVIEYKYLVKLLQFSRCFWWQFCGK